MIGSASNSEDAVIQEKVELYFKLYYKAIQELEPDPSIGKMIGLERNRTFVVRNLEHKIRLYRRNPMLEHDLKFKCRKITKSSRWAVVDIYVWCAFRYLDSPDLQSGVGSEYTVTLMHNGNGWDIFEIVSDNFEFTSYKHKTGSMESGKRNERNRPYAEKELLRVQQGSSFFYNAEMGARYASHYANWMNVPASEELFWYEDYGDCTNFVSQCVWAAYGGWVEGYTQAVIAQNALRIKGNIRQVAGAWHGSKESAGSNRWCRVLEFHDFVINKGKARGPFGSTFGDKKPIEFHPSDIKVGDVLQIVIKGHAGGNYSHSLYVTKAGSTWDTIKICCHSSDRQNTSLSEFTSNPKDYTKMRRLRLTLGKFEA